jgi:hypothetical protein
MFNAPHCAHCAMEENLLPHRISLAQCQTAMALEGRACANPAEHHQFVPQFRWKWWRWLKLGETGIIRFYLPGEPGYGLAVVGEDAFLIEHQDRVYQGVPQKDYTGGEQADSLTTTVNRTLEDWLFHRAGWSSSTIQRS